MQVLFAVIDDLWKFARTAIFGFFIEIEEGDIQARRRGEVSALQLSLLPSSQTQSARMLLLPASEKSDAPIFLHGEQYFIGEVDTKVFVDPVFAFDTVSTILHYGDLVYVQKLGGRWAHIKTTTCDGWVLKDVLREKAKDIFPQFLDGKLYESKSIETQQVRLYISDMFMGGLVEASLSDVEYITYMLQKKGKEIVWNYERPRIAGTWQKKLRGSKGVHIGIHPKTDSVMEYNIDNQGHLAYVEAVFPDETLKLTSIGLYEEGVYNETQLRKEEWKELRPVFIEIS